MRLPLLIGLCAPLLAACSGSVTEKEEDILARVVLSSKLDRDHLMDVMTMCEAMLDCYEAGCEADTDIRRHMARRPLTNWGQIMTMEFKAKGVVPMSKALKEYLKEESLQRADWPCRDFHNSTGTISQ